MSSSPTPRPSRTASGYLLNWFPKGSGPEAGCENLCPAGVWQKHDDFTKLGKQLQADAVKLNQVANSQEPGPQGPGRHHGKACKACHDTYSSQDYEKDNDE